jgi:hypothetical protein
MPTNIWWKILLVVILFIILIVVFVVPIWLMYKVYYIYNNVDPYKISIDRFLQIASWLQAVVAWITLLFVAATAFGIGFAAIQLRRDRSRDEWEIYATLTSNEMMSTKRFLATREVQQIMRDIDASVNALGDAYKKEELLGILESARKRCAIAQKLYSWPLLMGTTMSLEYIEMLVNKYNVIAHLINQKYIRDTSATGLALDNMHGNYEKLKHLIDLRKKISDSYAVHYIKYCESKVEKARERHDVPTT